VAIRPAQGCHDHERYSFTFSDSIPISGEEKSQNLKQRLGDINPLAVKLVLLLAAKSKLAVIDDIAENTRRWWITTAGSRVRK